MKKLVLLLTIALCCFTIFTTRAQTTATTNADKSTASALTGAWETPDQKEFVIMHDGFFSSIAQDSTGKWANTHAGTYIVDNANTMTLKVVHSSYPDHTGALHTVAYEIKGEMLTIKWFKKLVDAKNGDITD